MIYLYLFQDGLKSAQVQCRTTFTATQIVLLSRTGLENQTTLDYIDPKSSWQNYFIRLIKILILKKYIFDATGDLETVNFSR